MQEYPEHLNACPQIEYIQKQTNKQADNDKNENQHPCESTCTIPRVK